VNNPLGSHAGVQKLGAVYVLLACLLSELSSTLDNIILTSLFKTDTKKSFGNLAVFKNLIDELNYLETVGISVTAINKEHTIFFMVGLIIGDNLGMHSIWDSLKALLQHTDIVFANQQDLSVKFRSPKMIIL